MHTYITAPFYFRIYLPSRDFRIYRYNCRYKLRFKKKKKEKHTLHIIYIDTCRFLIEF